MYSFFATSVIDSKVSLTSPSEKIIPTHYQDLTMKCCDMPRALLRDLTIPMDNYTIPNGFGKDCENRSKIIPRQGV